MKVGIIQLTSALDYKINIEKISHFLKLAKEESVDHVFLPECFFSMSDGTKPTPFLVQEKNEYYEMIRSLAIDHSVYLLGGSVAAINSSGDVVNRNLNFSPEGKDLGFYDKINLFSCEIQKKDSTEKTIIRESDIYTPGNRPNLIKAGDLSIGASICFDLRFPELYREYIRNGANLLSISAAFTVPTGKAHWHTLIKARAIENQCFVVAPAQYGRHNNKITTFGHSLIVDPWGEVLVDAKDGEKFIFADLDLKRINEVRSAVKVF